MYLCNLYFLMIFFFFFKQKTAYEMRISDWSSDVCSSDLRDHRVAGRPLLDHLSPQSESALARWRAGDSRRRDLLLSHPGRERPSAVPLLLPERPRRGEAGRAQREIGRASCRARVCQYV